LRVARAELEHDVAAPGLAADDGVLEANLLDQGIKVGGDFVEAVAGLRLVTAAVTALVYGDGVMAVGAQLRANAVPGAGVGGQPVNEEEVAAVLAAGPFPDGDLDAAHRDPALGGCQRRVHVAPSGVSLISKPSSERVSRTLSERSKRLAARISLRRSSTRSSSGPSAAPGASACCAVRACRRMSSSSFSLPTMEVELSMRYFSAA